MAYRRSRVEEPWDAPWSGPEPSRAPRRRQPLPAEIAGLAHRFDRATLARAVLRAYRLGVGADEVLLVDRETTADEAALAAAEALGIDFDPLDDDRTPAAALSARGASALLRSGILRHFDGRLTVAARGLRLRALAGLLAARPSLAQRLRLTTPERLAAHVRRVRGEHLAACAAFGLRSWRPEVSAATLGLSRHLLPLFCLLLAAAPFYVRLLPDGPAIAAALATGTVLLGWSSLRFTACLTSPKADPPAGRDDAALPLYSIVVPLYREARVVPRLIAALRRLDYPHEKLQVLLVVEDDDPETRAAALRHAPEPYFEVVVAPDLGPRTKPKAMNAALAFARGEIVAVYDAEDQPDPAQLRAAYAVFAGSGGKQIACVQARLAIDNAADSWITRQFAAEYAGHFDLLLPMLAQLDLPFPLGGTSNHFRLAALEGVDGWDPFNVTEDADLGVRLARAGWRTAVIGSTTEEEAPAGFGTWLRQRTRWYKGWFQTALVHGRHPRAFCRELGAKRAAALSLLIGGSLVAALVHPFFVGALALDVLLPEGSYDTAEGVPDQTGQSRE